MRRELLAATALSSVSFVGFLSPAAAFEWSGWYWGGSVTGAYTPSDAAFNFPDGTPGINNLYFAGNVPYFSSASDSGVAYSPFPTKLALNSALGVTLAAGYNFQTGALVYGLEGDVTGFFNRPSATWSLTEDVSGGDHRVSSLHVTGGLTVLTTIRPRVGVVVDRLLLFGTGGLAVGQASLQTDAQLNQDFGKGVAGWDGSNSAIKAGFVVGGGAEYALTDRTTFKIEGLYYDLGSISATATGSGFWIPSNLSSVSPYTATVKLNGVLIRAGLNVKF